MLDSLLKLLALSAPFVKEMIFGDDNITAILKKNKAATIFFFVNVVLFCLLLYMSGRAFDNHWKLEEERATAAELKQKIKDMLPAGVEDADTVVEIARRISDLEREKEFYVTTLNQVYGEMDLLTVKMQKLILTCQPVVDSKTEPEDEKVPEPEPDEIDRAAAINRERSERLRALLNELEENEE